MGSRINLQSTDNSVNYTAINETEVFPKLREALESQLIESSERTTVLAKLDELEKAKGSASYGTKFKEFISLVADLMTIVGPFVQPLSAHIR